MKQWTKCLLGSALLCGAVQHSVAETTETSEGLYIIPSIGYYIFDSESNFDDELMLQIGGGYQFNQNWSTELSYFVVGAETEGGNDIDVDQLHLDGLYWFSPTNKWQPFVVAGIGNVNYEAENGSDWDETAFNFGGGVRYWMTEQLALRSDARLYTTSSDAHEQEFAVNLALNYYFSGPAKAPEPVQEPDADADGVIDRLDQCSGTPVGVGVDSKGCPVDADADGVADYKDKCLATPANAPVDGMGCALDTDGDTVPDYKDRCPETQSGTKIDEYGCYVKISKELTFELNVQFDTNSSKVRPQSLQEVAKLASFMQEHPLANVTIEGHTDSLGSAVYNKRLSQGRAESIATVLSDQYGIDASRVSAVGYGEAKPIASNDTNEGRQRNRRVVAVVKARVETNQ